MRTLHHSQWFSQCYRYNRSNTGENRGDEAYDTAHQFICLSSQSCLPTFYGFASSGLWENVSFPTSQPFQANTPSPRLRQLCPRIVSWLTLRSIDSCSRWTSRLNSRDRLRHRMYASGMSITPPSGARVTESSHNLRDGPILLKRVSNVCTPFPVKAWLITWLITWLNMPTIASTETYCCSRDYNRV